MRSKCMSLLPRTTLHSDSEHLLNYTYSSVSILGNKSETWEWTDFSKDSLKNLNCNVNTAVTDPIYARIEIVTGFFLVCLIFLRVDRPIQSFDLRNCSLRDLKRQSHEIFDLWFFRQTSSPRPQFITLKCFRK